MVSEEGTRMGSMILAIIQGPVCSLNDIGLLNLEKYEPYYIANYFANGTTIMGVRGSSMKESEFI